MLLASSSFVIAYFALHHGSYSLIDRQQMAVFVWVAIGVAAVAGVLPAVKPPRVLLIPLLAILALAAWTLLSMSWTESGERTFAEFARIVGYLGVLVLVWIGVGRATWRLVAAGLLSAGVLVCLLVMLSRLWPALFPSDTVAQNLKTTRINYPFGYWNAVGCWCAMTITLCLAYAGHARSALVRGLALGVVPMCSAGLYMAVSRAGFGGVVLGALVVVVLSHYRWLTFIQTVLAAAGSAAVMVTLHAHQQIATGAGTAGARDVVLATVLAGGALFLTAFFCRRFEIDELLKMPPDIGRPLARAGALAGVLAAVALAVAFGGRAYDEFTAKQVVDVSTASSDRLAQLNGNRHNLWTSAWHAFEQHPLTGIGPGTFEFWWSRDGVNGEFVRDVHNIYLEALAELGAPGLILLLAFFCGLLWTAWAARRGISGPERGIQAGLIAVFAGFLFQAGFDWMWESTAVAVLALAAVAVAGASGSETRTEPAGASKPLAIAVASALAVIVMLAGLANARQIERSQAAFRAGDNAAAVRHADDAIDAERWSATAFSQRALALEAMDDDAAALAAIKVAEAKEPYNWRWPLVAAKIYVKLGDPEGAAASVRRARELRPFLPIFRPANRSGE